MSEQKQSRLIEGVVEKHGRDKTVTVSVIRTQPHAEYGKVVRSKTKFHVHDEQNRAKTGDKVRIKQCRPYSKTKTWELIEIIEV